MAERARGEVGTAVSDRQRACPMWAQSRHGVHFNCIDRKTMPLLLWPFSL
jgi:hypothetical protein